MGAVTRGNKKLFIPPAVTSSLARGYTHTVGAEAYLIAVFLANGMAELLE